MDEPTDTVHTLMPDLSGVTLADLRRRDLGLADAKAMVLAQVERPRANLGGAGPPGRAD